MREEDVAGSENDLVAEGGGVDEASGVTNVGGFEPEEHAARGSFPGGEIGEVFLGGVEHGVALGAIEVHHAVAVSFESVLAPVGE